jgi:hypothetical protein
MAKVSPDDIKRDLDQVEADGTFFRQRQDVNSKVRYARWDGQHEDGKKHEANIGNQPFPFEGASDVRVRLSESITNREVRQLKNAFKRSKLRVKGTEQKDWSTASKSTTILDWMVNSQMSPSAQREIELAAQWRQEKGAYMMRIDWHQETALEQDEILMDEINQIALDPQNPELAQVVAELRELILDGGLDEEAASILVQFNDSLDDSQALKAVKDLRETGLASFDVPYFRINRPRWTALRVYRDIYFPTYVDDIQRSRWVAERKYYTPEEIEEKQLSEGWSKAFISEVIEKKGLKSLDHWSTQDRNKFGRQFSYEETVEDQEDLIEIYHVYYKDTAKNGAIGVYKFDMSYFCADKQASKTTLLDYDHGLYPFVSGVREYTERGIIQSRGIGEILQTPQGEVKIQRDNAVDRTSIDIVPPMFVPASRSDIKTIMGPAMQIPVRRPGEIEFAKLPQTQQNTELIINQVMREVDAYWGMDPNDPNGNLIYSQDLIDSWLAEIKQVYEQTFALMQQYMPDVEVNLVTGGTLESYDFSREQIQGKYDLSIQFDARDMDGEMVQAKIGFWKEMMAMDTEGTISRTPLIRRIAEWVDPIAAEEILVPAQQIAQRELDDEQDALAKLGSGIEPPLNPEGKNAQMRLQIIEQSVMQNPNLQQRMQEDEVYAKMIQARANMFQQTLAQAQNAQIGRIGAQPALEEINQ